MIIKRLLRLAAVLALIFAISGCTGSSTITIGVIATQSIPEDQENAAPNGFDAALAIQLAGTLGFGEDKINWRQIPAAEGASAIEGDDVDLLFGPKVQASPEVTFAGPYYVGGLRFLVPADEVEITGPSTLNGKILCSVPGSTVADSIKTDYSSEVEVAPMDSYQACIDAIVAGDADAVAGDDLFLAGLIADPRYTGQLKVVGEPISTTDYSIALKKDDDERCQALVAALTQAIDDGNWQRAFDSTVGVSGFTADNASNPPVPGGCE